MNRQRTSSKTVRARPQKAAAVPEEEILEVFEFWRTTMNRKRALLSEERKTLIGASIHDYGVDGCKEAIRGCSLSPFHMGANQQRRRYDSLELIFRNAEKTESFQEISGQHAHIDPF